MKKLRALVLLAVLALSVAAAGYFSLGLELRAQVSAPFTVTVTPSGSITCDTGGPATLIPSAASAGGFTTCILYMDFTQTTGFASSTTNFMTNCGSTSAHRFTAHFYDDSNANDLGNSACNDHAFITTAPNGQQSLLVQDVVADHTGSNHKLFAVTWPTPPGSAGFLSNYNYNEITFQATGARQIGCPNRPSGPCNPVFFAWWHRGDGGTGPNGTTAYIEYDDIEIYTGGYTQVNAGPWNQPGSNQTYFLNSGLNVQGNDGVDWTQVHRSGFLVTSNGTNASSVCYYFDRILKSCFDSTPGGNASQIADTFGRHDTVMNIWMGNCSGETNCLSQDMNVYIFNIQMWGCSSWQTGVCPGPIVRTAQAPNPTT